MDSIKQYYSNLSGGEKEKFDFFIDDVQNNTLKYSIVNIYGEMCGKSTLRRSFSKRDDKHYGLDQRYLFDTFSTYMSGKEAFVLFLEHNKNPYYLNYSKYVWVDNVETVNSELECILLAFYSKAEISVRNRCQSHKRIKIDSHIILLSSKKCNFVDETLNQNTLYIKLNSIPLDKQLEF